MKYDEKFEHFKPNKSIEKVNGTLFLFRFYMDEVRQMELCLFFRRFLSSGRFWIVKDINKLDIYCEYSSVFGNNYMHALSRSRGEFAHTQCKMHV